MSQFKPYPAYKDSGVEWLGEVPEHWRIGSFRHLIISVSNGTTADQVDEAENTIAVSRIETISSGSINFEKTGYVSISNAPDRFLLNPGDILFSHINSLPMVGNVAVYSGEKPLLHGMNLLRIQPRPDVSSEWVLYWLKSKNIRQEVESRAKPAINQASVSTDSVRALPALIPSKPEQTQIARFLDYETARIDALIEEQKHLIELLKEKRQAVISHTVTKGLDPTVPMKDSGVEWLGEVPAHWDIGGLTRFIGPVVDYRGRTPTKVDDGTFLVTARNIRDGRIDYDASQEYVDPKSAESLLARGRPEIGDLLFTMEAPLGQVALIDKTDIALAQRVVKFRGLPNVMRNNYLLYWFMSKTCQARLETLATGSTALGIKASKLGMIECLAPTLNEQDAIITHIQRETANNDALVSEAEKVVILLQERRSALISAAVTGKIDVRDWQPPRDKPTPSAASQETCSEAV